MEKKNTSITSIDESNAKALGIFWQHGEIDQHLLGNQTYHRFQITAKPYDLKIFRDIFKQAYQSNGFIIENNKVLKTDQDDIKTSLFNHCYDVEHNKIIPKILDYADKTVIISFLEGVFDHLEEEFGHKTIILESHLIGKFVSLLSRAKYSYQYEYCDDLPNHHRIWIYSN